MKYRVNQKNGDSLSILGYGCMRFSRKGAGVDQEKAEEEMLAAVKAGVNYFDTAYIYPGSEVCLGKFLKKYDLRDKVKVATKLPHYFLKKPEDIGKYFNEQLERLRTDYVDYYLMHMLNDTATWERLCGLGIREWIAEKKASGQIKNLGFSFHGGSENFKKLLEAYDWDFCQVQFNYMDEHSQAGIEGINAANEKGIPVVIMEPLRGGRLVNKLPKSAIHEFETHEPKRSPVDWALRWIWDHPQVNVVLSGMNDMAQVEENCRIADSCEAGRLTAGDFEFYSRVLGCINSDMKVGCTGCGYCQPCPKGVAIPTCFALYNASYGDSYITALKDYVMCTTIRKNKSNAGLCVECGRCESHCPQSIHIRDELKNVKKRFETPLYKVGSKIVCKIMKS